MTRTKLKDRKLPPYSKGEEIANMVTHIIGGALGIVTAVTCIVKSFLVGDAYRIVGSFIFGISMITLYTMSSLYHGLKQGTAKKVFQVIDHCTIFILIAGTYTPICLSVLREANPMLGWGILTAVWAISALGISLNAIDLKRYSTFSLICYVLLGWCIVLPGKTAINAIPQKGFVFLLLGGVAYTVGAVLYAIGGKRNTPYIHTVFHIFVVIGSLLQYFAILFYII